MRLLFPLALYFFIIFGSGELTGQSSNGPVLPPEFTTLSVEQQNLIIHLTSLPESQRPPTEVCRELLRSAGVPEVLVIEFANEPPPREHN